MSGNAPLPAAQTQLSWGRFSPRVNVGTIWLSVLLEANISRSGYSKYSISCIRQFWHGPSID